MSKAIGTLRWTRVDTTRGCNMVEHDEKSEHEDESPFWQGYNAFLDGPLSAEPPNNLDLNEREEWQRGFDTAMEDE
jgi:ribosome modulation factor